MQGPIHQQSKSLGKQQQRGTSNSNRGDNSNIQQNMMVQGTPNMPTGDAYQGFSFVTMSQNPAFQFSQQPMQQMQGQLSQQQQQQILANGYQMQQPQVHFIAKQQKFYGISPERAPLIFNNGQPQDKRPYTSSGQAFGKNRSTYNTKVGNHNSAIAALYLGQKSNPVGFNNLQVQQRNSSQPTQEATTGLATQNQIAAYSMHSIPSKSSQTKRVIHQANSAAAARKQGSNPIYGPHNAFSQKETEALYEEAIKMKQLANMHKEENIKLKTKIKILDNEMSRKERALEDFFQQNQFIQNAQKNQALTGPLAPIAQTAQRYQQETFLVMSLKKQVKELKQQLERKEEELQNCKKNIKQTRFFEAEQEIKLYKDELIRLRYMLEQQMQPKKTQSQLAITAQGSQPGNLIASQSFTGKMTTSQSNVDSACNPPLTLMQQLQSDTTADNLSAKNELPNLKAGSNFVGGGIQQMGMTGMTNYTHQNLMLETTPHTSNPLSSNGFSSIDHRGDAELVQILNSQLAERDATIRAMQEQLDIAQQRKSFLKQQETTTPDREAQYEESKPKSTPHQTKETMTKLKKQVRDKEKEIMKLKQEISNAATINAKFTETSEEENNKKIKKLEVQVSNYLKKTQDLKSDATRKDGKIEQLNKECDKATEQTKLIADKHKKEQANAKKLQIKVDELTKQVDTYKEEIAKLQAGMKEANLQTTNPSGTDTALVSEGSPTNKQDKEKIEITDQKLEDCVSPYEDQPEDKEVQEVVLAASSKVTAPTEEDIKPQLDDKIEGELCLAATVLGCRNNKDRIEFAQIIKDHVAETKGKEPKEDDELILSEDLRAYVEAEKIDKLALLLPKYEFISPSLGIVILNDVRKMLYQQELLEILSEKETEEKLPFDALRELCVKFEKHFTDEQCAFICATYLVQIDTGVIFINFMQFLSDIKDLDLSAVKSVEEKSVRATSIDSASQENLDSGREKKRGLSQHLAKRDGKLGKKKSTFDEEQMLDIAEGCFIRIAELMIQRGRTVRGIFTKYSVPEIFPDRTVLELLSPIAFLEGVREAGLEDLQEMEAACLMRVLSKPELDNAIILNELVLIMENFGVLDQMDEEDADDYVPDTETEFNQSVQSLIIGEKENADIEESKEEQKKEKETKEDKEKKEENKDAADKSKIKKRVHNIANIDAKGVKILRKLARYLLKQFLHPREFFGKSITKEHIKTKKREFHLDVLKMKDFYLKIKIANIRKKLIENESLNMELCLDKKHHKDIFNVKLLVKALEELAEEEQTLLIKEEKEAKEKKEKEKKAMGSLTAITESEPDTPRSEDGEENKDEEKKQGQKDRKKKSKTPTEIEEKKMNDNEDKGRLAEYFGPGSVSDVMKFGNSRIQSSSAPNSGRSPLLKEGAYHQLNTIEEDKAETQTSNYFDATSEREDSRLMGSNNLRGSNFMKDFDLDEEQKKSLQKFSPEVINQSLPKEQENKTLFDDDYKPKFQSSDRITKDFKEKKLSQSVAETSINRFKESNGDKLTEAKEEEIDENIAKAAEEKKNNTDAK